MLPVKDPKQCVLSAPNMTRALMRMTEKGERMGRSALLHASNKNENHSYQRLPWGRHGPHPHLAIEGSFLGLSRCVARYLKIEGGRVFLFKFGAVFITKFFACCYCDGCVTKPHVGVEGYVTV